MLEIFRPLPGEEASLYRRVLGRQIHQEAWRSPEATELSDQFTLSECHTGTTVLCLVEDNCNSGTTVLYCEWKCHNSENVQNVNCNANFYFCLSTIPDSENMTPISFGLLFSKVWIISRQRHKLHTESECFYHLQFSEMRTTGQIHRSKVF